MTNAQSDRTVPILVAMGGNSLLDPKGDPGVTSQFAVAARALRPVADLVARGVRVVLTHGNGPQVGFMLLRSEFAQTYVHRVPLDSLVADSQGALGYMIQLELRKDLARRGMDREVASVVTCVEVDPNDRAFLEPTKPVGKFYTAEEAEELHKTHGWSVVEDSKRGWRRVVPSPPPIRILELATIRALVDSGVTTIACGGGGIPIMRGPDGEYHGIEAVIDKDRASALLAEALGVRRLFITTGVEGIYADFHGPNRRVLREVGVDQLGKMHAAGEFPPGSMGPKVEAAICFLEHGGDEAVICTPEALAEAFDGRAGTRVTRSA